ncbi:MAG: amidohydrolase [Clostridia bacterium]|nr:amidohydrolase [Clostridia bacterium]
MEKQYKIIDFHTHPFPNHPKYGSCQHKKYCNLSEENTITNLKKLGIVKICGSVIKRGVASSTTPIWSEITEMNNLALELAERYNGFYIPGFHVHPEHVKESIAEIERMDKLGVKLLGEIVPYLHRWSDFSDKRFWEILEAAEHYKMVFNFHAEGWEQTFNQMDEMVKRFKNLTIVGAHPNEGECLERHMKRLETSDNYYVDISGSGITRHGMLRHLIDEYGKERIIYGSDYPVCSPATFIGGVTLDFLLTEEEKEYILYKNAERILAIK